MIVVQVTFPSVLIAQRTVKHLLEKKLIACAHVSAVQSIYTWKGKQETAEEGLAMLKTEDKLWKTLAENIKAHHPYENPEIIKYKVDAVAPYKKWLKASTRR